MCLCALRLQFPNPEGSYASGWICCPAQLPHRHRATSEGRFFLAACAAAFVELSLCLFLPAAEPPLQVSRFSIRADQCSHRATDPGGLISQVRAITLAAAEHETGASCSFRPAGRAVAATNRRYHWPAREVPVVFYYPHTRPPRPSRQCRRVRSNACAREPSILSRLRDVRAPPKIHPAHIPRST